MFKYWLLWSVALVVLAWASVDCGRCHHGDRRPVRYVVDTECPGALVDDVSRPCTPHLTVTAPPDCTVVLEAEQRVTFDANVYVVLPDQIESTQPATLRVGTVNYKYRDGQLEGTNPGALLVRQLQFVGAGFPRISVAVYSE